MDRSDYSILVGRLEREVDNHPLRYRSRVIVVAALGYAPVALAAAAIVAGLSALLTSLASTGQPSWWGLLGLIGGGFALVATGRALSSAMPVPPGQPILRDDAPALFAAIDEVIDRMSLPKGDRPKAVEIDSVAMHSEPGLWLHRLARRGVFGGVHNHLQLGLPLMAALGVADFKVLLAREIASTGGGTGGRGGFEPWICRQRDAWRHVRRQLAASAGPFSRLLAGYYGWYADYFHATTFACAREHEYAADRATARATNAVLLAAAMIKVPLIRRFLEEVFWPRLFAQVEKSPEPQYLPYSMMPRAFVIARKQWSRQEWLEAALRAANAHDDACPRLGERLAALKVAPALPPQVSGAAALSLLGEQSTVLLKQCDDTWFAENGEAWRKRHALIGEAHWKIAQYENTPVDQLRPEDLWEKALLLLDLEREGPAIEVLYTAVAAQPSLAKAQFLLGKMLLEHGDERGLQHLVLAAQHNASMSEAVTDLGYTYLMDRGRKGEASRFSDRVNAA